MSSSDLFMTRIKSTSHCKNICNIQVKSQITRIVCFWLTTKLLLITTGLPSVTEQYWFSITAISMTELRYSDVDQDGILNLIYWFLVLLLFCFQCLVFHLNAKQHKIKFLCERYNSKVAVGKMCCESFGWGWRLVAQLQLCVIGIPPRFC